MCARSGVSIAIGKCTLLDRAQTGSSIRCAISFGVSLIAAATAPCALVAIGPFVATPLKRARRGRLPGW